MLLDLLYALGRPLLFQLDAEQAHNLVLGALGLVAGALPSAPPDPILETRVGTLTWPSPLGLAAGLDKDGSAVQAWAALGFGAVEVGTVTAVAQPGNPRPRLFRYPEHGALINRMGFNNGGAPALADRLLTLKDAGAWPKAPVGVNIGRTKAVPNDDALLDYRQSVEAVRGVADYLVLNVSSPNTPGLRALQEAAALRLLLEHVRPLAIRGGVPVPLFLKLAPDLGDDAIADAVDVAVSAGCDGIIATNTTITRPGATATLTETGGLSGQPLATLSRDRIVEVLRHVNGRIPVIGVGGLRSSADILDRLRLGCAAVQLYTGLVFEGPGLVRRLNAELAVAARAAGGVAQLRGGFSGDASAR